ncbi:MAG TPA: inosine/xanthosine triphosphatase [Bacteroidota bacterium]
MVIAIASIRPPKVDAVRNVFSTLAPRLKARSEELQFLEFEIESGVEETPRSLDRIVQGAKVRGVNLRTHCRDLGRTIDFAVGLEGGLFSIDQPAIGKKTFLQSWAYVTSNGGESFGASGAILVPDSIADPVMRGNQSLSDVIDRIAVQTDVRSRQGTWGVLTQDLISRQASFETALTNALARFYNPVVYGARP